ncbi:tetratricopeptide repeat protein [Alteromonas sp. ASW11-19]|uniref:Tetratricopeptide repeat protein n=1 Tax=Alteromonas salexigens TaxID=2982530 RepID=A0ABT2VNL8_9ALTE|nr:tetratricopeptide repeat protein [Alteromonas salexigens]MCU7554694.1 tetratricopeptide repeat protein [Alteromonas salexigens]
MSVVNKMLKDLESRDAETGAPSNYRPPAQKKAQPLRIWVYSLVTVAVLVVAVALLTMPERVEAPSVPQTVEVVPAEETNTVTAKPIEVAKPVPAKPKKQSILTRPISEIVAGQAGRKEDLLASEKPLSGEQPGTAADTASAETTAAEDTAAEQGEFTLTAKNGTQEYQNLRERIRLALDSPDKREAITLMRELAEAQPDNVAVRKKLAAVLFANGQAGPARDQLIATLDKFPADHSVRLMLARLYQQQGQTEQARQVLATAEDYLPVSTDLIAFRASLAQTEQRFEQALTDYHLLVARAPDESRWWLGVATSADHLGQAKVALNAYRQALSRGELNTDVQQFMRQRITVLAGDHDE